RQPIDERRLSLDQPVRVREVLQPLRSSPCRIGSCAELRAEQIELSNHAQGHRLYFDLLGSSDRLGQRGIVGELHRSLLGSNPILRILEGARQSEAGLPEALARNLIA